MIKKPVRSKSGIIPLTVVLPAKKCEHGTCIYCPGGDFVPQSYTDKSPAIMRAAALGYDVCEQVRARLNSLKVMGHPTDKIEVIIIGGTFLQYEKDFKYNYIKKIYDVLNGVDSESLLEAQKINESAKHRVVALCIENRPDNCSIKDINEMREFGATRVEIGVQILDNEIYKKINRGHSVQDVIDATKRLKDAGFKIGYHIMPGLPFSNPKNDFEKFKLVFSDSRFRPDQLKLYPCQIVDNSQLALDYKKIGYISYSNKVIKNLLKKMLQEIPNYCRVMRVMREIPKEKIKVEAASTSMRGDIQMDLKNKNIKEIRMREIGFQRGDIDFNVGLKVTEYEASGGQEFFLEMVNNDDVLFGLLRLRLSGAGAMIREVHVYGQALKLGEKGDWGQHSGLGKLLISKTEEIAKEKGFNELRVISGVGVREYYRKLGYGLVGGYMVKIL
jgi:elongator complex protein 3